MSVSKRLTIVFLIFYLSVIIYLFLFLLLPDFQNVIMNSRQNIVNLTKGASYIWAIIISVIICLLGSASIGFPVPFPFVLFLFSNSLYSEFGNEGFLLIIGIAIAGGLGAALGELTSYLVGKGAKRILEMSERTEIKDSKLLKNIQGFGRLVIDHPKHMYFYIFLAAALPIPDDPLWIALGMAKEKFNFYKLLIWGWAGKNITTLFYVFLPVLITVGFYTSGIEVNDKSSIITEAILLLVTITVMFFIMSFDWEKYLVKRNQKKLLKDGVK